MLRRFIQKGTHSVKLPKFLINPGSIRHYKHIKDLNETMYTAALEEEQRSAKFLEYTSKIYKPSKTITFNRNGEVLLYYCDNYKHSQGLTKYPYILIDACIPLIWYNFFVDPCI
jgi:hypothetical protein